MENKNMDRQNRRLIKVVAYSGRNHWNGRTTRLTFYYNVGPTVFMPDIEHDVKNPSKF
jgi:hypothetical protein